MAKSKRIIECVACHKQALLSARGMCHTCYCREYVKTHPPKPYPRTPTVTYACERCGVSVTKTIGRKNLRTCDRCYQDEWHRKNHARRNAQDRVRRAADPEKYLRMERAYRAKHPERARASSKRYRERHPERVRESQLRYESTHPERLDRKRATTREWHHRNRPRHAATQRARKARIRGLFVEHVHSLIVLELHDGVCGICGEDVDPGNFHVDHIIPLALGGEHSYANTQPAHPVCNHRKGARPQ